MKWFYIKSMSFTLQEIKEKLSDNKALRFLQHSVKIIEMPDYFEISHWSEELFWFCEWIMSVTKKPNKKSIDKDLIKEYFFGYGETLETFKPVINNVCSSYKLERKEDLDEQKFNSYRVFCDEVLQELVQKTLTKDKMKSLVDQHLRVYRK